MKPARRSAYQVVAEDLRSQIRSGGFSDGRQLPTEVSLAEKYGLSRQTVRRAFQDLVSEGLVHRVPRRGTFVVEGSQGYLRQFGTIDELMGLSIDTEMEILEPLHRAANIDAAGRLRVDEGSVYSLVFARLHDDLRFCVTYVHLEPSVGAALLGVPELSTAGARSRVTVIGLIEQNHSAQIVDAEQSVTAVRASSILAGNLCVDVGDPLLRIDRLYVSTSGRFVELATSYFLPSQYAYRVRLRRTGH